MDVEYPNDGAWFQPSEPVEQKNANNAEKAKVMAAIPLLNDLLEYFTDRISYYDSVDSIPMEERNTPEEWMLQFNAQQLSKQHLTVIKGYLEGLKDTYTT